MAERYSSGTSNTRQLPPSSRLGLRTGGTGVGEIVEVEGGHIVRSTGRKDRHSKVCTAKGPRDRRVRLSAHTAIQFYDVQDRLGYDRPSKAVDWLIKKAKAAIDELEELPAWHPTATAIARKPDQEEDEDEQIHQVSKSDVVTVAVGPSAKPAEAEQSASAYGFHQLELPSGSGHGAGFLPASLDSDAIADTIKSFFPMPTPSSSIHFQNYPPDLLSRTSSRSQDLRLSLQSVHDPILLHTHHQQHQSPPSEQTLFTVSAPLSFETASSGWSEQQQSLGRFQRSVGWSPADVVVADAGGGGGGGGFVFSPTPQQAAQLLGQDQLFPQRGPLQSSNSPPVRAWAVDPSAMADHPALSHAAMAAGFASGSFSGFRVPARIQGEEEHDAAGSKPASSASRH